MSFTRRVVVTGVGMVSPLGLDAPKTWTALLAGKSGICNIKSCEERPFIPQYAGTIKNFKLGTFKTRNLHRMDLFIQYGLQAAQEAIIDANLENILSIDKKRVGVSIASGLGGFTSIEEQQKKFLSIYQSQHTVARNISPFFIPGILINMISGLCSIEHGFQGPNFSVVSACATGAHSIGLAARSIQGGDADIMVAGGAEMGSASLSVAGFAACRALSTYKGSPSQASRPWDKNRDGFVLSDGAAVLVLEEYEHAIARGANIYAEILGFGMSADAYSMTTPEPSGIGAKIAIQNALLDASIHPQDVDYINAHATSTRLGDKVELKAIESIWKEHAPQLKISSTKSSTGHLLGAAGALEAAFCLLAIRDQIAPATINLESPESGYIHLNLVPHAPQSGKISIALSNSFGFGGANASLIFGKV